VAATKDAPRTQPAVPKGAASSGPGHDAHRRDARPAPPAAAGRAAVKLAAKLGTRPDAVVTRSAQLAAELAKVGLGRSSSGPAKGDRRFKDDAWQGNPAFRRLLQGYLAAGQRVDGLIDDAGLDWRSERQIRFACENVLDALAPSNAPLTNPAVLKATLDTGGPNFAAARPTSAATWPSRRGSPRWSTRRRSPSARTSRSRRAPSCCAARCSSSAVQAADVEGARAYRCCSRRR
jgi:polyhydroxyalkanoate synthase